MFQIFSLLLRISLVVSIFYSALWPSWSWCMESESLASTTPNLLHNKNQVYVEASASTQTNAPLTQPDQLFDLLHLSQEHLVQLPAELTEQLTSMVPLHDAEQEEFVSSIKNSADVCVRVLYGLFLEKVSTSQEEDLLIVYGNILQAGEWVLKDDEAALRYYAKAGSKGRNELSHLLGRLRTLNDSNAKQLYGKILEQGLYGVRQNLFDALTYYKDAGERGKRDFKRLAKRIEEDSHPMSLLRYGKLLEQGIVVEKNIYFHPHKNNLCHGQHKASPFLF